MLREREVLEPALLNLFLRTLHPRTGSGRARRQTACFISNPYNFSKPTVSVAVATAASEVIARPGKTPGYWRHDPLRGGRHQGRPGANAADQARARARAGAVVAPGRAS